MEKEITSVTNRIAAMFVEKIWSSLQRGRLAPDTVNSLLESMGFFSKSTEEEHLIKLKASDLKDIQH